ncbi:MAG: hypothetical protein AAFQ09_02050 [Pseudomonadota bacterium]
MTVNKPVYAIEGGNTPGPTELNDDHSQLMPNLLAYFVLFTYPLVVVILFRRLPLPQALVWSIMGGYLFLPERTGIDLPLLPAFNKLLIPSLMAAIMCFFAPKPPMRQRPGPSRQSQDNQPAEVATLAPARPSVIANLCIATLFIAPVGIALTNSDWVVFGPRVIPGLRIYDAFSMMLATGVMLLPFFLARRYLATPEAHMDLLKTFVKAGLVYSVLILIEIRFSPQLHRWFYGFHAHDFIQQIRFGGFRPMVFIQHGLRVGVFMLMVVIAAFTLYKIRAATRAPTGPRQRARDKDQKQVGLPIYIALYLLVILLIAKAVGAFMIACIFIPVLMLFKPTQWRTLGMISAVLVLLYPMARSSGVVPLERVYGIAAAISEDRAASFRFRLENEERLLIRASQKPVLGWGIWGRSRVYDPTNGRDISTTDGIWVIVFGVSGWVGYLAQFGLLTLPIFAYFFARGPLRHSIASQGLCLLLAANLIDLIPNSGLTPVSWMVAGALLGRFERREPERAIQPRGTETARRHPTANVASAARVSPRGHPTP